MTKFVESLFAIGIRGNFNAAERGVEKILQFHNAAGIERVAQ